MKSDWKKLIPQCFCYGQREFVGHPSDEETAFELLALLRAKGIGWPTFVCELRRQLKHMPKLSVEAEVQRVRERFQIWMLD